MTGKSLVRPHASLRLRVAIPLLVLVAVQLLFTTGLIAQAPATRRPAPRVDSLPHGPVIFRAPEDDVVNFMNTQALACQIADTAKSADLARLDRMLELMIEQQALRVQKLSADSAPGLAAKRTKELAEAGLKPLETELKPLEDRKREIDELQKSDEAKMTAAQQGDAPPGTTRLAVLEAEIPSLQARIAEDSAAQEKDPNKDRFDRYEGLINKIKDNREKLAPLIRERDQILQTVKNLRENPAYAALVAEEAPLDVKIADLTARIKRLNERLDAATETLSNINLAAIDSLATLHDRNGFVHQYLSQARDCIQKRRTQLAGAPATPAAPAAPGGLATTYLTGHWNTTTCSGGLPPDPPPHPEGGDMNFYFSGGTTDQPEVRVRVAFVGSAGKPVQTGFEGYGATGRLLDSGAIADGRGGGGYYTLVWDGRIEADLARSTGINLGVVVIPDKFKGSGNVTVSDIYRTGGGTCVGTWTAATP